MTPSTRWRRYGSIRISRDGRVRYSDRTHPILTYISFLASSDRIEVESGGRTVLFLDLSRGKLVSACFPFDLAPDELRRAVSDLRQAGRGIEHWIVPGLELAGSTSAFRRDNPSTHAIVPELLQSCRDLPVAPYWKRVREGWLRPGR